jgi:hypothetical protein
VENRIAGTLLVILYAESLSYALIGVNIFALNYKGKQTPWAMDRRNDGTGFFKDSCGIR